MRRKIKADWASHHDKELEEIPRSLVVQWPDHPPDEQYDKAIDQEESGVKDIAGARREYVWGRRDQLAKRQRQHDGNRYRQELEDRHDDLPCVVEILRNLSNSNLALYCYLLPPNRDFDMCIDTRTFSSTTSAIFKSAATEHNMFASCRSS